MSEIADLTTRRARVLAQAFMTSYQRQRDAMRIVGLPSAELAEGDDGDTIVADVAACMTVATSLPRVGLTPAVLDRMRTAEEGAFHVLSKAAEAYFGSEALRRELGRIAVEPFRLLREALPGTA
ncbi:hypothetical protein Rumeso_01822 [Rubellimicrobium mesophilum DSM 19309]|uniref:Uncharacterized protein n=1 Tax=Rubellimicrobium mesophilum DSM 19309 TaxID=442562 RepID=A0A017HSX7_9RHOB|nr:hypothetical protein [Rubellimicrobium mesophilum]EYD76864.1 hypothetical protein Rumeso_01822 [Rubellimicrobium mesophilum DSM 19309]